MTTVSRSCFSDVSINTGSPLTLSFPGAEVKCSPSSRALFAARLRTPFFCPLGVTVGLWNDCTTSRA